MTVSAAPRRQLRSGLLGAFAFTGLQSPLLLATLFVIGPGTIFPIVIAFGCGLVAFAVGPSRPAA